MQHTRAAVALLFAALMIVGPICAARASDHLDTPTVIADPRADIGDLYAWMDPSGEKLNLAMTIVGHEFSPALSYVFHIESGARFGRTQSAIDLNCRFASERSLECRLGDVDIARGDPSSVDGLSSQQGRFRVFAGLRDDPFFNNVRGTRAAYNVADRALQAGAPLDGARCPGFDAATIEAIRSEWRHTEGGPGRDFLAGWTPAALVVSVDLAAIDDGGRVLAVWAATASSQGQVDRAGRPLTGNALLGTLSSAEISNALKEDYNGATPSDGRRFVAEIETSLGLYDAFDGVCGNQVLATRRSTPARYQALARVLADDRLWVNSAVVRCEHFFAVELASRAGRRDLLNDCGGRTPIEDAIDVYRSELVLGAPSGVDDGVERDDHTHSLSVFPFLAPPDGVYAPR